MSANTDDVDSSSGGGGSSCATNCNFNVAIVKCHHYHLPNECVFTTNSDDKYGTRRHPWQWEMVAGDDGGKMSHR